MKDRIDAILKLEQAEYLELLLPPSERLLAEMERSAAERGIPISDREVGRLLELLAGSCGARRMLEVGTAIGYGALCLARGAPRATVVSLDRDPERQAEARSWLERGGVAERVELLCGEAVELLPAAANYRATLDELTIERGWVIAACVVTIFIEGTRHDRGELDPSVPKRPAPPLEQHPLVVHYGLPLDALALRRYDRARDLWIAFVWYVLAKVFEAADVAVFDVNGVLSGHTIKHLCAAAAPVWFALYLTHRRPVASRAVAAAAASA